MISNLVAQASFTKIDFATTPHSSIESFLYWDTTFSHPVYQVTIFQNYNLLELSQNDIDNRSKIYRTFLTHTEKFISSLLQEGSFNNDRSIYHNDSFAIVTKHLHDRPVGSWQMCVLAQNKKVVAQYSDIIALYALMRNKSYKQAIHILSDYIEQSKNLFTASQNKAGWFVQEKNPVNIVDMSYYDDFTETLERQIGHIQRYTYKNKHDNKIAIVTPFVNTFGEHVNVFYTIQRRYNSPILSFVPLPPDPPYTVYNLEKITKKLPNVYFVQSEHNCGIIIPDICINVACPYGLSNLDKIDFSPFFGKNIRIHWDGLPLHKDYLLRLKHKTKNTGTTLSFLKISGYKHTEIDIDTILSTKKYIIPNQQLLIGAETQGFSRAGVKLPSQDRKRKTILEPIIESGTITWLFSKEKVGKTLVALSIAHAVGKGNRPVGTWLSNSPQSVLFIDGEMPGDKIANLCDMIMRGYGDNAGHENRPFDCYLFYEEELDYDSIVDDDWLALNKKKLLSYDLVILDNYYSLNENRINIKPFIKLLKELTHNNVAVIVVDHTNTEGELQGSQIKRRAADLGIKLENVNENTMSIKFEFDRYGKGAASRNTYLEKFFFADKFRLSSTTNAEIKEERSADTFLTPKDKKILYVIALKDLFKYKQIDIAKLIGIDQRRVSEYYKSARGTILGTSVSKYKPSNDELFKTEYERISKISKEAFFVELESFNIEV